MQNVVLDRRAPRALVKLCDFGFSMRNEADTRAPVHCSRAVGTPDYMVGPRPSPPCPFSSAHRQGALTSTRTTLSETRPEPISSAPSSSATTHVHALHVPSAACASLPSPPAEYGMCSSRCAPEGMPSVKGPPGWGSRAPPSVQIDCVGMEEPAGR